MRTTAVKLERFKNMALGYQSGVAENSLNLKQEYTAVLP